MKKYCTYITFYSGNKLPPYYIGYTFSDKILTRNYYGSVKSKLYSQNWKSEIVNNQHLFKTKIIRDFDDKIDAQNHEVYLQKFFNVVRNEMYINRNIAGRGNNTGCIMINNGINHKFIPKNSIIPDGWIRGKTSTATAKTTKKIKGKKHNMTTGGLAAIKEKRSGEKSSSKRPEVRKKISDALTGVPLSQSRIDKIKIFMSENNPFKGKKHSEKSNELNRQKHLNIVVCKNENNEILRVTKEEFDNNPSLVGIEAGTKWCNNGIINKKYRDVLPVGFVSGRKFKEITKFCE